MVDTVSEKIVHFVGTGKDPDEITAISSVTAGTATASKAVVLGASKEINGANVRMQVNADVAGAGTVQADAAALLEGFTVITGANGTLGWKLPVAVAGMVVILKGTTSGVAKIWPNTSAQINAVAVDTAYSMASGVLPQMFVAKSATQWYTLPLVAS